MNQWDLVVGGAEIDETHSEARGAVDDGGCNEDPPVALHRSREAHVVGVQVRHTRRKMPEANGG